MRTTTKVVLATAFAIGTLVTGTAILLAPRPKPRISAEVQHDRLPNPSVLPGEGKPPAWAPDPSSAIQRELLQRTMDIPILPIDPQAQLLAAREEYAASLERAYQTATHNEAAENVLRELGALVATAGPTDSHDLTNYRPVARIGMDTLMDLALLSETPEAGWNAVSHLRVLYGDTPGEEGQRLQDRFGEVAAGSQFDKVRWWAMQMIRLNCDVYVWIRDHTRFAGDYVSREYTRQVEAGNCQ